MADEEKKSSNALIKYLLIAIAFLIMLILSAVVSIFTYRMVMDKKEVVIQGWNGEKTLKLDENRNVYVSVN